MKQMYSYIDVTPLGSLLLLSDGQALTGLYFADKAHAPVLDQNWCMEPTLDLFVMVKKQLQEYLVGKRQMFTFPYLFDGGTPFQRQVWHMLSQIPFGNTQSYKILAQAMGKPKSVRAVAAAVARNPISIILPCHRIIGGDGSLTGYAGGLECKKFLLHLEQVNPF